MTGRTCPRCRAPLAYNVGRDEECDGDVRESLDCTACAYSEAFTGEPLPAEEWRRRVHLVVQQRKARQQLRDELATCRRLGLQARQAQRLRRASGGDR